MKAIIWTTDAVRALRRHGNMRERIQRALLDYATDQTAHVNNVTVLVGRTGKRLRVGGFRVIFDEDVNTIIVRDIGPRGNIYE
jgi:mRNA interferase RelE/StbE